MPSDTRGLRWRSQNTAATMPISVTMLVSVVQGESRPVEMWKLSW